MAIIKFILIILIFTSCEKYSNNEVIEEFELNREKFENIYSTLVKIPIDNFGLLKRHDSLILTYGKRVLNNFSNTYVDDIIEINIVSNNNDSMITRYKFEINLLKDFITKYDYWYISKEDTNTVHFLKSYDDPEGYFNLKAKHKVVSFLNDTTSENRMEHMDGLLHISDNWYLQYNTSVFLGD